MTTLRLRPEDPADTGAIRRVLAAAFARPDVATPPEVRLVEELRGGDAWLPELAMVAEYGGEIVGYALLTRVTVCSAAASVTARPGGSAPTAGSAPAGGGVPAGDGALTAGSALAGGSTRTGGGVPARVGGSVPALALGPVAVAPHRQRIGLGTAVVQAALDAATELDERLVVVLGDPAYYRRFGFSRADRMGLTSPWSGLGEPWQALLLPPTDSGEPPTPHGEVLFPPPWSKV
ncbi:GNAT family N-acetyltransferase [Micromonospora sp. CA-263727]|uniref:GNAT family N-acetyltransferase n=1 Tax=Micromonospora sp. CA-263727 TaxID=3239967 RepID=UPI003D918B9A